MTRSVKCYFGAHKLIRINMPPSVKQVIVTEKVLGDWSDTPVWRGVGGFKGKQTS